jgi:hypothetical protein
MTTTTTPGTSAAVGTSGAGRTVSIVGIVLGALALIFGLIAGLAGLICGIVGAAKGNRLGWVAIGVSVVCTIIGVALGLALIGAMHH